MSLDYARPLQLGPGKIARALVPEARSYYADESRRKRTIRAHGVTVELIPATNSYGRAFLLGIDVDGDSGGWVGEIYLESIKFALKDKIEKTKNVSEKFDRWVLVLVDSIMPGISWVNDLGPMALDLQHFNGVAVINPDGSIAMEWPNNFLNGTP